MSLGNGALATVARGMAGQPSPFVPTGHECENKPNLFRDEYKFFKLCEITRVVQNF